MGYPQRMTFTKQELDLVDQTKEVRIETSAPDGPKHRTIIWAVVEGGDVLIRSYYGPGARWYREALANPSVILHVGDQAIPARAIPAADDASIASASAGFERKYAGDPAAVKMVRPEIRDLTLRLERS